MARRDALLRLTKTLITRRNELRKRLGFELQDLGSSNLTSSSTGDAGDAAFDTGAEEIASQLAELEAKELTQVERALRRLKSGTYGVCEGCSQKIPVLRLNALPYSTLCIKCQREMELDGSFLSNRGEVDWDKVRDGAPGEDREIDLSDLEMDLSK